METKVIGIIGLQRIGASVGLALHKTDLDLLVLGHDSSRDVMREAVERGAVDKTSWRLSSVASQADILVLAIAAGELEDTLKAIGDDVKDHTLVLDLSLLKGKSQQAAEQHLKRGHFVGVSAVLAAEALTDARRGIDAARPDLFQDSVFCVVPAPRTDPQAVETAVNFGGLLGAKPFFLDPAEYDSLVKGVETIPGLLAAAMFRAVTNTYGWRDMLRFASQSFALATVALQDEREIAHLALHDQPSTLRWLDSLVEELQVVRRWVAEGDQERLEAFLEQLGIERDKWLHERAENDWEPDEKTSYEPLKLSELFTGRHGAGPLS